MKRIFLFFFFVVNLVPAQNIIRKSIIDPDIEGIYLDVKNNFQVSVHTAVGNEMLVEASIDGEYSNDIQVDITQSGHTLFVHTGFRANFRIPNDKLSAHKVVSIALRVSLPEQRKVVIYGTGCNVSARGKYELLTITLSDGRCVIENITGVAKVTTQSGPILISADSGKIWAASKYGVVDENHIPIGDTFYEVNSITGDIHLDKIE